MDAELVLVSPSTDCVVDRCVRIRITGPDGQHFSSVLRYLCTVSRDNHRSVVVYVRNGNSDGLRNTFFPVPRRYCYLIHVVRTLIGRSFIIRSLFEGQSPALFMDAELVTVIPSSDTVSDCCVLIFVISPYSQHRSAQRGVLRYVCTVIRDNHRSLVFIGNGDFEDLCTAVTGLVPCLQF